jgi:hypothetical protein
VQAVSNYLLFGFMDFCDGMSGGWNDFHSAHETLADARNVAASLIEANKSIEYYAVQIVDAGRAELIETLRH